MGEIIASGFAPGSKYATISKEFYREIQADLDRIKTAGTVESAQAWAKTISEKLQVKYEPKYDVAAKLAQVDQDRLRSKGII